MKPAPVLNCPAHPVILYPPLRKHRSDGGFVTFTHQFLGRRGLIVDAALPGFLQVDRLRAARRLRYHQNSSSLCCMSNPVLSPPYLCLCRIILALSHSFHLFLRHRRSGSTACRLARTRCRSSCLWQTTPALPRHTLPKSLSNVHARYILRLLSCHSSSYVRYISIIHPLVP